MPPYYGAEKPEGWLNTTLVALPPGYGTTIVRAKTVKLDKSGACGVPFTLAQPRAGGTLSWGVPNAPAGSDIVFDVVHGKSVVLLGVTDGSSTVSLSADSDYTIANVTGGNGLSAYFEVTATFVPPI